MVLDADALNALASPRGRAVLRALPERAVLTPHPGEFERLCAALGLPPSAAPASDATRALRALVMARQVPATIVVKGRRTSTTQGSSGRVNSTGNAALATAGTGDVLAGVIAGLIAQFAPGEGRPHARRLFDLAALGVRAHGLAGDAWVRARGAGAGLLASELTDFLPQAIQRLRTNH